MNRAAMTSLLLSFALLAACGGATNEDDPAGSSDAGGQPADAASGSADAGATSDAGQTSSDAGQQGGDPNLAAVGTWQLSGTDSVGCGMSLKSGFQGVAIAGTTHEFKLTLAGKFNEQPVVLRCELGQTSKFTCEDYLVGMTFSGCNASGGMRAISGHINGADVDLIGTVHSTGTGPCPPTVFCGPRNLSASGTVVPN